MYAIKTLVAKRCFRTANIVWLHLTKSNFFFVVVPRFYDTIIQLEINESTLY